MTNDQLELPLGDQLKREAIDRVIHNTPLSYRIAFESWVIRLPHGAEFTSEDVTAAVGQPPHHANSVGALINDLARRGCIFVAGRRVKAKRSNQHSAKIEVWVRN